MNITLNLIGKPNKLSTFLLVWQGGNSEYFCEFIHDKDYETAIYTNFDRVYGRKKNESL